MRCSVRVTSASRRIHRTWPSRWSRSMRWSTFAARKARTIPVGELHELPGEQPQKETVLAPGELITHVELPATPFAKRSRYVKVRDRASFAFALASAAVAVELEGATLRAVRIALGGVATKPWRAKEAEELLVGKKGDRATFAAAAAAALADA